MSAINQIGFPGRQLKISAIQRKVVAYRGNSELLAGDFYARVAGIARCLQQRAELRWALVCNDTYWFATGFLALAQARKTVILPQAGGPANVQEAKAVAVLTDQPTRFPSLVTLDVTAVTESVASAALDLDDGLHMELYTSGSTGHPKRVDKLLGQLRAEVSVLEAQWGQMLGDAVVLATVPHHHLYGLLFRVLWPLWASRPFYAPTCTQPFDFKTAATRFRHCLIVSSPAFLTRISDFSMLRRADVFRAVFSSGAPLPETTAAKFASESGRAAIEVYGSTETGGIAWRHWETEAGLTPWHSLTGVEIDAPENTPGLLRVCSPWTWQAEWVETGDFGLALPQRRFLLCGRADGVLKVEDKRVSLAEMERRLAMHEFVSEVRLLLLQGKRMSVGAVVVLSPTGRLQLQRVGAIKLRKLLLEMLRTWYEPVLIPRKWRFVEKLPDNAMGKIEMAQLQALFTERG